MLPILFITISIVWAQIDVRESYVRWTRQLQTIDHPESNYRYLSEIHKEIAHTISETGHVVEPFRVGKTVENRTIWGFKIRQNNTEHNSVFVLGGIHPMEWVSVECYKFDCTTGLSPTETYILS